MSVRGAVFANAVTGEFRASPLPPACPARAHLAMKADPAAWASMRYRGIQQGGDHPLELRDCPMCFSTLAIEIPEIPDNEKENS